jgi:2-oxo-4-hydroxy-4-carboxy-5-ureidoimidazoline decarboxylase
MIDVSTDQLRSCLAVERWVGQVASAAPFESFESLIAYAGTAATPLATSEIDEAIAHHPRIGEKPVGQGASQDFSRREQSAADSSDERLASAIATGNAAYEERFGRVFIIRAAGRSRAEILDELNRRLKLDDSFELAIVGEQLRDIALLRLTALFGPSSIGDPA